MQTNPAGSHKTYEGVSEDDWLPMGGGRRHPQRCPDRREFVVTFEEPHDWWNPQNWRSWKKLCISTVACCGTFVVSFNSAIFAAGAAEASKEFRVGKEVTALGTSLFVLGFAFGPMLWAPGSELIGRRWPLSIGMFGSSIFTIGCATSKDIQTLVICRFFAGLFGASPLCVVPAVLADLYNSTYRGMAISIYALTVFGGPFLAPCIGEFITISYLGWRWTLYLPAILGLCNFCFLLFLLRETFAPVVLVEKAIQLRRQTGNWAIHAEKERLELNIDAVIRNYLTRPLQMLVTEPIILLVTMYMSFIYGLVYALLGAYPYVFSHVYGMPTGVNALPFLGLFLGVLLALIFILCQHRSYTRKLKANNDKIVPEWRLGPAIFGAFIFAIGLFWFSWTAFTHSVHWMAPSAAGVLIGFGVLCIFLPCFNYLVDAFVPLAASTVAANIMLRSAVAAGFPLFSTKMFENLGVQWAGTLLACLATVMIPIPVVFRAYGPMLRGRSKMLQQPSSALETPESSDTEGRSQ
ncbi:MFS general substrate transporter [Aaosphaeria arxii CBS 175.79]|uniref:MFS general substrate transporter n=1 Tax=Aaosphaeria arxii CBS 175.79 TaxID=1450172 RepID=A0A6A5XJZ7_9PLEO|nr:MFS general substrate transporter [Aaosphaeria arxii CBS 175.79]KAF2013070.1 MFS general substrate transporter [Aaosphaeria arxii CBS 175.79]